MASAERVAGAASPSPALVALSPPASGASAALPSGAPCSSGTSAVGRASGSSALARGSCTHGRVLGAGTPTLAAAEASDGPSRRRSSPDAGRHALGRAHWLVLA